MIPSRVWVTSDIHIDYQDNFDQLVAFAEQGHPGDALIIAGDASDRMEKLQALFEALVPRFRHVLFIPGNHELWVKRSQFSDSLEKFHAIRALCERCGVKSGPLQFGAFHKVWLVPLFSWYDDKDQPKHSLYVEKDYAADRTDDIWGDFVHARWPQGLDQPLAELFADMNESSLSRQYPDPVISFSHFLPRQDLIFHKAVEESLRMARHFDPLPEFNFSRVAGSTRIEEQLRRLGSALHIYGHQHRNRLRNVDGVTYFSHCMGYPKERERGHVSADATKPACVWRDDTGFCL
ncbi:hypothetical protein FT643_02575 [Ketobacter sp. MCCC 1A13808]|uniref:metallophosphoesterase n=1 Tax=Ketobacter sp. MCCC 1A13808 TaxID=2602738 RepID=UPI0012EB3D6B|nr:metallophosphoesterase [Ketobacter sp. MCCC 1A13808]MVF11019.1 hypothetical protein [Ketobacter sp. MCCC 1A13808]